MTPLQISQALYRYLRGDPTLLDRWWLRYHLIVRESSRGLDCPYARQAWRLGFEEQAELIRTMVESRDQLNLLIEALQDVRPTPPET